MLVSCRALCRYGIKCGHFVRKKRRAQKLFFHPSLKKPADINIERKEDIAKNKITFIDLSYNALSWTLPLEFGALSDLEELNLRHNRLKAMHSQSITKLTKLKHLHLDNNQFYAVFLPLEVTSWPNLQEVTLHNNYIAGKRSFCKENLLVFTSDCADPSLNVKCECCTQCYIAAWSFQFIVAARARERRVQIQASLMKENNALWAYKQV